MTQTNSGYHIIRADRAGVFIGKIVEEKGAVLTITNARRLLDHANLVKNIG